MKVPPGMARLKKASREQIRNYDGDPMNESSLIFWILSAVLAIVLFLGIVAVHEKSHPNEPRWLTTKPVTQK